MIVTGTARRWCPAWWSRRCGQHAARIAQEHHGFERLVIQVRPGAAVDTGAMVDPACEPLIRDALKRAMILDPPIVDDNPYVLL